MIQRNLYYASNEGRKYLPYPCTCVYPIPPGSALQPARSIKQLPGRAHCTPTSLTLGSAHILSNGELSQVFPELYIQVCRVCPEREHMVRRGLGDETR